MVALSETRREGSGTLVEQAGFTFFGKAFQRERNEILGVGFAVKNNMVKEFSLSAVGHSPRLMSLRIPLTRGRWLTVVSVYAPTLLADISVKEQLYGELEQLRPCQD